MTFYELIAAAIADIQKHGYDSRQRLDKWLSEILKSAYKHLIPTAILEQQLRRTFTSTYDRMVKGGQLLKLNPGVSAFTINNVQPKLHAELQRRIMSSAQLIKRNREEMINKTLQRFEGWATSVPAGGSNAVDKMEVKKTINKALKNLPFEERRVMIDQGHKFVSSLNDIVAVEGGAIAGKWRSHWKQPGYDYRVDHAERDEKYYAIRGNWALEKGLMNKGEGYTDDMTQPGFEIFCRCSYTYIYSLQKLPEDMLTKKGKEFLTK